MIAKYDRIGIGYNKGRKADPQLVQFLLKHLQPEHHKQYLDIGCGTGNYTIEIHRKALNLIGIDPSEEMLNVARKRSDSIDWKIGTVINTGMDINSIDGVIGSLTIHHWPNLPIAFKALHNILRKKGKLVLFTSTNEQMQTYWLHHYFPEMMKTSADQMPSLKETTEAMQQADFTDILTENYFFHPELEDHFLYCGKHRPELYLSAAIRKGISSFSSLADEDEIRIGLESLRADVDSGMILKIIGSYDNSGGDYKFITAQK